MKSAVATGNNPESKNNTPHWEEAGSIAPLAHTFGRKPKFKNIRELTDQDVESLKCKPSIPKPKVVA